ncbi:hypothetical protein D5086_026836 [Populus alba]|uniref:Uncharacterized protein n=1 Tax=Populus alba TaxID=43335 RepID=A0ACC4B4G4_POPAL
MAMGTMMTCRMMSISPGMPSSSPPTQSPAPASLPLRTIPGSYGWPLLGPISDRLDYFWFQGPDTFFKKRTDKYKSTVFRTNVPPTFPFFAGVNPNVVAVLDTKSFAYLFDMDIVEKKNILVGEFMPSVKFTGNIRTCAYLDTSEPQHTQLKNFAMGILKRSSKVWLSELVASLDTMWDTIDTDVSQKGSGSYLIPLQQALFKFLVKSLAGADPSNSPEIAESGYAMLDKWLALQLLPTIKIGILQPLEEIFLHSFSYPFFLVSGDYNKLYQFIRNEAKELLRYAETEFGLNQEDTIHNLLFILGFNAFGGFSIFLPVMKMPLVQSVVYETLRLSPPVPLQFARARKDFQLSSHDSVFDIKKGELLCGYQPLVMRDPEVFDDPESFRADRFMGEEGGELLKYLYWSNGPQTGSPSASNKQCAAKDYVTLTGSMMVAYLLKRYDSITGDSASITAVEKAVK